MRPPGKTHAPPWNASFDERRSRSTSNPASPSRRSTTVAAGAASTPIGASAPRSNRSLIQLFDNEVAFLVARPQHLLVELADRRLRDLVDEAPPLGHLPARDAFFEEGRERLRVDLVALLHHHARERALLPTGVGYPDDARFDDGRVCHQVVLELDRADPFAARLDDVLGAVGDVDVAL